MKHYTITAIDEADYGCEGRPEGEPALDRVWLNSDDGETDSVQEDDALLYERNLDEGSRVIFDREGHLAPWEPRRLAVIFPGIGYHTDKPLLYYAKKLAKAGGYDVVEVPYNNFPKGVKGNTDKMREAFESAIAQAEEILADVDFRVYDQLLFMSKSVGTVVASAYARKYGLKADNIFYTPVAETFSFVENPGIVFHGTSDSWVDTETVKQQCIDKMLPLYITEDADHSMETGDVMQDLVNLREIMSISKAYIDRLG